MSLLLAILMHFELCKNPKPCQTFEIRNICHFDRLTYCKQFEHVWHLFGMFVEMNRHGVENSATETKDQQLGKKMTNRQKMTDKTNTNQQKHIKKYRTKNPKNMKKITTNTFLFQHTRTIKQTNERKTTKTVATRCSSD